MIVPTMTELELKRELELDIENVANWEKRNENRFRRLVLKSKKFPVSTHYIYISPRKNRWIITLTALSKKDVGKYSLKGLVATYETNFGTHALVPSIVLDRQTIKFHPPHFFKRYKERMGLDLKGLDLIAEYFKRNNNYTYEIRDIVENGEPRVDFAGSTVDGVTLGYGTTGGNILTKTFITYDMLKGEQIETYMNNNEYRKEMAEIESSELIKSYKK